MHLGTMFTAVFDLDGTLADTSGDLLAAANARFESLGYPPVLGELDKETARNTAHAGGRAMLKAGAMRLGMDDPDGFAEAGYLALIEHYRAALSVHTKLYDNALDVLRSLQETGWQLSICTNKPIDLAEPLIQQLGLASQFEAIIGVNSMPERKPHPKPLLEAVRLAGGKAERAVLIGDSATDYHTAKAAGAAILLVDFDGTRIGEQFPDAPVVYDFIGIENWLQNWREGGF